MAEFDVSGFLASFFDEAGERLQRVGRALDAVDAGAVDDAALTRLRRDLHTIKGSAQMLGVADVAEAAHLFEDMVDYLGGEPSDIASSALGLMRDLHATLEQRLKQVSGKPTLDLQPMQARFTALKSGEGATDSVDGARAGSQSVENSSLQPSPQLGAQMQQRGKPVGKRRKPGKKKRSRVPSNLIAAVMGSLEGGMQPSAKASAKAAAKRSALKREKTDTVIDYRPDLSSLPTDDVAAEVSSGNFLRVDRERLNRLSNQIIELGSGRYMEAFPNAQLQQLLQSFGSLNRELANLQGGDPGDTWRRSFERNLRHLQGFGDAMRTQQQRSTAMLDDLRDQVRALLLRPVGSIFAAFPHAVRDAAKRHGKQVQLLLAGESVEMDQQTAEALGEALLHLINNAVAHGIEPPEQRKAAGKPEQGQITVTAMAQGKDVQIVITDDGHGMDRDLIRQRGVEQGVISEQEAADMDASEILELVFYAGFSTSERVDESAGRGMGLSIVQDVLHDLTGTIGIQSEPGKGTQFTLTVPVTLAVRQAMVFSAGDERFGLLDHVVCKVLPLDELKLKRGHGPYSHGYIDFEQHRVPMIDLTGNGPMRVDGDGHDRSVIIIQHLKGYLGLVVDRIEAEEEILVRDIDPYLKRYHPLGVMGCTITGDGSVLLIIDPDGLKEMWRTAPAPDLDRIDTSVGKGRRLMLVDDSAIALRIEKTMLERMGFSVDTVIGGADAIEKIGLHDYDLLVTDLGMPGMDGIELTGQLRSRYNQQTLPILMLAAIESESEKTRALEAGVDAYMVKRHLKDQMGGFISTIASLLDAQTDDSKSDD